MRKLIELYNPEQKQRYIDASISAINSLQLFKKTAELEKLFDKDLCEFDISQYITLFDSSRLSHNSYNSLRSAIKKYVMWCINNGIVSGDQMTVIAQIYTYKVPTFAVDNYKYFRTPDDVFDVLEKILLTQGANEHIINRVCCAYAIALEQITPTEMCEIKRSDVDLESRTFRCGNSEFPITDRTYKYFEEVYYSDKLYILNSDRANNIKSGEYLFRTSRADHVDMSYFMNIHGRLVKGAQNKLPIGNELRLYDLGFNNIINNRIFMNIYEATGSENCTVAIYNQSARIQYKGNMTIWDFRNKYKSWFRSVYPDHDKRYPCCSDT